MNKRLCATIELPIKPLSVNQAFFGKHVRTKLCREFDNAVCMLLKSKYNGVRIDGWVELHYIFHLKNWKRTDGDNLIKVLQDSIVRCGLIEDDCKVARYIIEKRAAKEDSITVTITASKSPEE